jgi:ABC-type Fe3+/spermidine/putrescine transport system ATPase subunit
MQLLELKGIQKKFEDVLAIDNLNLSINKGEFVVIVGPSGCGKSTLLKSIAGVISIDKGKILHKGKDISKFSPEDREFSMVWQHLNLFPHMNVIENIEFGLKTKEKNKEKRDIVINQLLKLIGLEKYKTKNITQLSGGEKQRVAIARSLAVQPEILLLDEPFSSLDAPVAISLKNEIKNLQKQLGITFIMVTHNISEAFMLADKIVIMNEGKIVKQGKPEEIYKSKNTFVNQFISHQISVDILRGKKGMEILFEDMLNYPLCQFIAGGAGGGVSTHMPSFWKKYNKRRVEKKVLWQDLLAKNIFFPNYEKHRSNKSHLKENEYYEFRVMPKEVTHAPHVIFIYGEKVVNVIWEDEPLAFIIDNKYVSENHKEYFKYLWKRSTNQ